MTGFLGINIFLDYVCIFGSWEEAPIANDKNMQKPLNEYSFPSLLKTEAWMISVIPQEVLREAEEK